MENHSLTLAPGEKVVNKCQYLHMSGKKYEKTNYITLTNKRLIESSVEDYKSITSVTANEIPIADIDSVEGFLTYNRRRIHPIFLVLFVILMIFSIGTFIGDATIVGIVLLVIAVAILGLGLLLRKKEYKFSINIGRISYQHTSDHLALNDFSTKKSNLNNLKKGLSARLKQIIFLGVAVLILIGLIVYFVTSISQGDSLSSSALIYVIGFIVLLSIAIPPIKKASAMRGKNSNSTGKIIPKLKIEINGDAIRSIIDKLGAQIYDLKQQNVSTLDANQTNISNSEEQ